MAAIEISLTDQLRDFVDEQVSRLGFGSDGEYVRELIRRELDREQLRARLMAGAASAPTAAVDAAYFAALRRRVHKTAAANRTA